MSNKCTHPSGCNYPIQNKKYGLCGNHMYEKTHGRSKQEVYAERAAARPIKPYQLKTYKPPKQQTKKQAKIATALGQLKHEIEMEAVLNDMYYCQGCGKSYAGLDKSHLLSIGQYKHLELVKENIQLMCRTCHLIWESKVIARMIKLFCFFDNLKIIKELDINAYRQLVAKLDEYTKWLSSEEKDAVDAQRIDL